jgi:hypothetical protein
VSALVNKRAEIAGMITRTEQQLGQFRADLVHLDATIRLFAPEMEPKTIPAKRIRQSGVTASHFDRSAGIVLVVLPPRDNPVYRVVTGRGLGLTVSQISQAIGARRGTRPEFRLPRRARGKAR